MTVSVKEGYKQVVYRCDVHSHAIFIYLYIYDCRYDYDFDTEMKILYYCTTILLTLRRYYLTDWAVLHWDWEVIKNKRMLIYFI